MSFGVHVELTSEAPWAENWCSYYALVTNTGSTAEGAFELQHEFFGPDGGRLSHGGLGAVSELPPGASTGRRRTSSRSRRHALLRASVWQNLSVADGERSGQ
jgi:hypothetical protein